MGQVSFFSSLGKSLQRGLLLGLVGAVLALALVVGAVSATLADTPSFPDVPETHPYYTAITDLASRNIVAGYTNGDFGPDDGVKRQQFTKMVALAAGYEVTEADVCPFLDVEVGGPTTLYPDNFVAVCAAKGITVGKTATSFDPYASITRYQVVTMIVRAADDLQPGLLATPPEGWTSSAGWDLDATHGANAARAEYNGLLTGLDLAALDPYGAMTRGEVAQILHNLLLKLVPPTTTTTAGVSTTTTTAVSTTTTTTAATTTTTASGTTTSSTTSTTLAPTPQTYHSIAGLEQTSITVTVLDQFGNPYPQAQVFLTSTALEGSGLTLLSNQSIGFTDGYGNVAYTWSQVAGSWGVEEVTATVGGGALTRVVALVQWIYDDRSTNYLTAAAGGKQVAVAAGLNATFGWSGRTLSIYLNPSSAAISSGLPYVDTGVTLNMNTHTWSSGEAYFVGANSTDTDTKLNWMYNVVP